jgi:hypothetical protein
VQRTLALNLGTFGDDDQVHQPTWVPVGAQAVQVTMPPLAAICRVEVTIGTVVATFVLGVAALAVPTRLKVNATTAVAINRFISLSSHTACSESELISFTSCS